MKDVDLWNDSKRDEVFPVGGREAPQKEESLLLDLWKAIVAFPSAFFFAYFVFDFSAIYSGLWGLGASILALGGSCLTRAALKKCEVNAQLSILQASSKSSFLQKQDLSATDTSVADHTTDTDEEDEYEYGHCVMCGEELDEDTEEECWECEYTVECARCEESRYECECNGDDFEWFCSSCEAGLWKHEQFCPQCGESAECETCGGKTGNHCKCHVNSKSDNGDDDVLDHAMDLLDGKTVKKLIG